MLTAQGCAERRRRLFKSLRPRCDYVIISDPNHLIYFANYYQSPFVFRAADASALLVVERERATLLGDNIARPFLEASHVDRVVVCDWYDGVRSATDRRGCLVNAMFREVPPLQRCQVGIEEGSISSSLVEYLRLARAQVSLTQLEPNIREMRRSKGADELELLRLSIRAGAAGQAAALKRVEPGMTELDVYLIVHDAVTRAAGHPVIVYGDFVSGERCETECGGPPSQRKIERGDLFLLDFSVVVHGYRGDLSNTFVVGGKPTKEQRRLYKACLGALRAGEGMLRPGRPLRAVDATMRAYFAQEGLEGFFTSHSGHGIGLGHPEAPFIVPESSDTLVQGDVIALEPGLYVPGTGGMRFEHNYLITQNGFVRLSRHKLSLGR